VEKSARKLFKKFFVKWGQIERLHSATVLTMVRLTFIQEKIKEGFEINRQRIEALGGVWWSKC